MGGIGSGRYADNIKNYRAKRNQVLAERRKKREQVDKGIEDYKKRKKKGLR